MNSNGYDVDLFERLKAAYRRGEMPDRGVMLTSRRLTPRAEASTYGSPDFEQAGLDKVARGEVAAVVLAGGLATRFGGLAKAAVEIEPGWSLLRVKLELVARLARAVGRKIPTWIIVSQSSRSAVVGVLEQDAFDDDLEVDLLQQGLLPQLDVEGELLVNADGHLSFNPPGHGESLKLLGRHCRQQGNERIQHMMISNIDNLLGSLQPECFGLQDRLGADLVEVVEGTDRDVGGVVVDGEHGVEIIEGFRVRGPMPSGPRLLSTNTICLRRSTVLDPPQLPWNAVTKKANAVEVVQFEQLIGEVGIRGRLRPVVVERLGPTGRFAPLKTTDALDDLREPILSALRARGLGL
jgi:UTP--glucose-1-phosphate uridylyltransferase